MGAWKVMSRRMPELVPEGVEFRYIGRPERASPGEGYPAAHRSEQERIVLTALRGLEPHGPAAVAAAAPSSPAGPALFRLGQGRVVRRARPVRRAALLLAAARASRTRPRLRPQPRPRLHRPLPADLDRRAAPRGALLAAGGDAHPGRPGGKRDRDRLHRAAGWHRPREAAEVATAVRQPSYTRPRSSGSGQDPFVDLRPEGPKSKQVGGRSEAGETSAMATA